MKYKNILVISWAIALIINIIPVNVFAASASVYISPSSSTLNLGDNITVQVRVNSGADLVDSVQASLNFDITKLQFVSYSDGFLLNFKDLQSAALLITPE